MTTPRLAPAPRIAQNRSACSSRAGAPDAAVGGDDLDLDQVVDRPPEAARQVAEAAAERQARHADLGDEPERRGEPVELGLAVDVAEQAPGLHGRGPRLGVDAHPAQAGHVERQPAVGDRGAGDVVAAAAHRQREAALAGEADRGDDVGRPGRLDDERRGRLDHAVPQPRRVVEARLPGQQHGAADVDASCRWRRHAASVPIAVRSAAANASGCSIGGSSAQSSITCSGHP